MKTLDERAREDFLQMAAQAVRVVGSGIFTDVDQELEHFRQVLREVEAGQRRWFPVLRAAPTEVQQALLTLPRHIGLLERRSRELAENSLAQRILRGGPR